MRHRVELKSLSSTRGSAGTQTNTYATYATVWASVNPLRGLELINAQQVHMEITHKITIRYNSSLIATDRILFDGRTFEIASIIDPYERNVYLELMCKEVK